MNALAPPTTDTGGTGARLERGAPIVGAIALVACVVGAFVSAGAFFEAYLFAYVFWLGVALGSLALLMAHHLTGGVWGFVLRRIFEAGAMTVPLLAILFVPLLFGLHHLYLWTEPDALAASDVLRHKHAYLNIPFFIVRAIVYFTIWTILAWFPQRLVARS